MLGGGEIVDELNVLQQTKLGAVRHRRLVRAVAWSDCRCKRENYSRIGRLMKMCYWCALNGSMQRRRSVYPLGFESLVFLEVFGSASVRLRPNEPVSESRDRFSSGSTVEAGR